MKTNNTAYVDNGKYPAAYLSYASYAQSQQWYLFFTMNTVPRNLVALLHWNGMSETFLPPRNASI